MKKRLQLAAIILAISTHQLCVAQDRNNTIGIGLVGVIVGYIYWQTLSAPDEVLVKKIDDSQHQDVPSEGAAAQERKEHSRKVLGQEESENVEPHPVETSVVSPTPIKPSVSEVSGMSDEEFIVHWIFKTGW